MRLGMSIAPQDGVEVLNAIVEINRREIRRAGMTGQTPILDGLFDGSVIYVEADPEEEWKTWSVLQADGGGDCEDIVPAIVAEAREAGIDAKVVAYLTPQGIHHVVAELPGGVYVDPSRQGGM